MLRCMFFGVLVGLCLIHYSSGAAFFNELERERTEYGTWIRFCTYEDKRYGLRSRFRDLDTCTRCRCTRNGLSCYTMTYGVFVLNENEAECMNVVAGCKNRWVLKRNPRRKCPDDKIPPHNMIGK